MINWKNEENELKELLLVQNQSYEAVGRKYGVSGTTIKNAIKKLGINIPPRRKINSHEHFNKGTGKKKYCKFCGKPLNNIRSIYCSNTCHKEYEYTKHVTEWLNGKNFTSGPYLVPNFIKRYLLNEFNHKCEICGWGEVNKSTGLVPLQIHHIDGDCTNNKRENLQLLCPNCHSLTSNFGSLNKESKRFQKRRVTKN